MRRIALTPVYNEEKVVVDVLEDIKRDVDLIIIVNDGSNDSSKEKILEWKRRNKGVYFLSSDKNEGCSTALRRGYAFVTYLLRSGQIDKDDLVIELDSDGQHDPAHIKNLFDHKAKSNGIDIVLAQRDFSNYPRYKIIGNRGLTYIASILGSFPYNDVESNFRITPANLFPELLKFYTGYRYSAAFEIGIIFGLLKYKTDNSFLVKVPYYRAGSRARDGIHIVLTGLYTWLKIKFGIQNKDLDYFIQETVQRLLP